MLNYTFSTHPEEHRLFLICMTIRLRLYVIHLGIYRGTRIGTSEDSRPVSVGRTCSAHQFVSTAGEACGTVQ